MVNRVYKGNLGDFEKFANADSIKGNYNERQLKYYNDFNGFVSRSLPAAIKASKIPLVGEVIDLFANGEEGAWYDPSDSTTLYQDADGTNLVSSAGDPIGLMIDKHLGPISVGPEIVIDGGFTDAEGWIADAGWTVTGGSSGIAVLGSSSGDRNLYINTSEPLPAGMYLVEFDVIQGSQLRPLLGETFGPESGGLGSHYESYVHVDGLSTSTVLGINGSNVPESSAAVDNFTVKLVSGNHASQNTETLRPTSSNVFPLVQYDNVDDEMTVSLPAIPMATVAIATSTGSVIQYPVDLSSGSYTINESHSDIIILDRELTSSEVLWLSVYLDSKASA